MSKVIIEAALNGWTKRPRNPHVAYTAPEVVDETLAVCAAGASIIHYHLQGPDGEYLEDVPAYGEVARRLRASDDPGRRALIWPTNMIGSTAKERFRYFTELSRDPATKPDLGSCDMGSLNVLRWDVKANTFAKHNVYVNSVETCREALALMKDAGLKRPTLQIFDPTHLRTTLKFLELGLLEEPLLIKFYLGGPEMPFGMPPVPGSLDAYLNMMPGVRTVWFACCLGGDVLPLAPYAVSLGGHVRLGLEDYAYEDEGQPSNVELVNRAATIIRAMGHEVATPEDTRQLLEL
jgi:3-keto-5-aminohexanoate cleavage enzyme